jgi:radical SAM superfamily enzyme YgiQ (UPF0313 family)
VKALKDNAMKKILLINPMYEMETLRVTDQRRLDAKADNMPLGLATVAALAPEDQFDVEIWDEFVRGPVENSEYHRDADWDLVGVTTIRVTFLRTKEVARIFRQRGIPVAVGGPGVTGSPDRYRGHFDFMFIGESELIWPQFLEEWLAGTQKPEYRQIEKPDMSLSPIPNWKSIESDLYKYAMGSIQTTRGCPFDCEFCDVIFLNGRRPRHKSIDQVLEELKALQGLGLTTVYFADDDFVGDHNFAKELLRAVIPLNNSFPRRIRFTTQASIDVARDDELLGLMADANFYEMLIGIESSNPDSLKEMGKFNNLRGNLVEEIHRVISHGISVRGAMICGFDSDGPDIFDRQFNFIQAACLPSLSLHMLNAPIGTRLWRRLQADGRVLDIMPITDKFTRRIISNIIPKQMSRIELMEGFGRLYTRVFAWESFRERMLGFITLASQRAPDLHKPEEPLEDLLKLPAVLEVDEKTAEIIREMFTFTAEKTPHLLGRTKELIIQFYRYSDTARSLIPKIKQQVELERSGAVTFEPDRRPLTISPGFRKGFSRLFPVIHSRVYRNLNDKTRVPAALVDSFVDFFVKEERVDQIEEHHVSALTDIADRTCASFNGVRPQDFVPPPDDQAEVPNARRLRLGEDVLNSVEQELIRMAETKLKVIQGDSADVWQETC